MSKTQGEDRLAVEGGPQAVRQLGPFPTKIGKEELWELIDLWDFSPGTKEQIRVMLDSETNLQGPHLFRYYNPRPSRVAAAD